MLAHENGLQGLDMSGSDPLGLPRASYRRDSGFHFWKGVQAIGVDDAKKVATCHRNQEATVVTEEVFNAKDEFKFTVKVCSAQGKGATDGTVTFGVLSKRADLTGLQSRPIGHAGLKHTIGAMCRVEMGAIVHDGEIEGVAPGLQDGDVVCIRVRGGSADFLKNGAKFHGVGLEGHFRFGVSLSAAGQCVEILDKPQEQQHAEGGTRDIQLDEDIMQVKIGEDLKLDKEAKLGSGAFGVTWRAQLQTPQGSAVVAVKVLNSDGLPQELQKNFRREVGALASLTLPGGLAHPHLVRLIAVDPAEYAIVTELCTCDLAKHVSDNRGKLTNGNHAKLMQDVACGGAWLAAKQYVHRDLKMKNILIANSGSGCVAKLADFGLARPSVEKLRPAGTLLYMAPESTEGHFSEKSDVYGFAFVVLGTYNEAEVDETNFMQQSVGDAGRSFSEMGALAALAGLAPLLRPLMEAMHRQKALLQAVKDGSRPEISARVPPEVTRQIRAAWDKDAEKRPSFALLCRHFKQMASG